MENAEDKKKRSAAYRSAYCEEKDQGQPQRSAALSVKGTERPLPELLAPAGELSSVRGAVTAGADAVYLGGELFSARAYARNLTEQELCEALDYVHLFGKKLYLACNTLIRGRELPEVFSLVDPLYERGLDGVILQDPGLLSLFSRRYPQLKLHASTQMSILSKAGAEWLKKRGVSRVVPGRELSLNEIRALKDCGLELEVFIHGAMCYSYSGRCLFSSMAGGRSGNRGRCAGPCRQPYRAGGGESCYPLSMKDLCSLEYLDELAEAGVDSLKIEGRMKAPEYSAGVTELYRKYLDRLKTNEPYRVEEEDLKRLEGLYLRSERQEGYLHRHNGREMISLDNPAYAKVSEEEKASIRARLIDSAAKKPVGAYVCLHAGEELMLSLFCEEAEVSLRGPRAEEAKKRPLSEEELVRQIGKTGDTPFVITEWNVDCDGKSFVPVAAVNGLRREALSLLGERLCGERRQVCAEDPVLPEAGEKAEKTRILVGLAGRGIDPGKAAKRPFIDGLILPPELYFSYAAENAAGKAQYLRLPPVLRQESLGKVRRLLERAKDCGPAGIYCDSLDALALAGEYFPPEKLIADRGLYVFNPYAQEMLLKEAAYVTMNEELNGKEALSFADRARTEMIVYGRTPLMYSANCIYKTLSHCKKDASVTYLKDELGHSFPVLPVHEYCCNILYNCVPLSLHREINALSEEGLSALRIEFTTESEEEALKVLDAYGEALRGGDAGFPDGMALSRGHYRKGAE